MTTQIAHRLTAVSVAALAAGMLLSRQPVSAQDVLGPDGLSGAGSTFVYPVLSRWSREYRSALSRGGDFPGANSGLEDPPASSALDYEAIGSLAGTLRLQSQAVDFGATDVPLKSSELAKQGLGQFPIVIGGVVVAVNIPGIAQNQLLLTGPVLADVFLGEITRWSDPAIVALNPGLKLPNAAIAVIHRSDGSGTTYNFTDYLSKLSSDFRLKVGAAMLVRWPIGTAAKGNEGVAQAVKRTSNSIGYVEYAQAVQTGLSPALIQNRAGRFVKPEHSSFQAAAASANWQTANDFYLLFSDAPGDKAYPLTATVFVLMHRSSAQAKTAAALDFFRWSLEKGSSIAAELGYVPLPAPLVKQVESYWGRTFKN